MIDCRSLIFRYPGDSFSLEIPELKIDSGEKVTVIGPSGCGKTTLLKLISGILSPASGRIEVAGQGIVALSEKQKQAFRLGNIGLVPQQFELLDYLTVIENVLVPYQIGKLDLSESDRERAAQLLKRVGVENLANRLPEQLSQGERQRVAICRGLVTTPKLILADEPTGNLDPENQTRSVELLLEQAEAIDATVVMVTHEPTLLPLFDRTIDLIKLRTT